MIKIITNESGDWSILKADGFTRSDHSLGVQEFVDLLNYLGYDVEREVITDEMMEELA